MAPAGNFGASFGKMPELTYVDARQGAVKAKRLFFLASCASQREPVRVVSAIVARTIVMARMGNRREEHAGGAGDLAICRLLAMLYTG